MWPWQCNLPIYKSWAPRAAGIWISKINRWICNKGAPHARWTQCQRKVKEKREKQKKKLVVNMSCTSNNPFPGHEFVHVLHRYFVYWCNEPTNCAAPNNKLSICDIQFENQNQWILIGFGWKSIPCHSHQLLDNNIQSVYKWKRNG